MLGFCTAPFATIIVGLLLYKLDCHFQRQKFKKIEKEMREKGVNENTIIIAKHFFTN